MLQLLESNTDQFAQGSTDGLENPGIGQTPEVVAADGLRALATAGIPCAVGGTNPPSLHWPARIVWHKYARRDSNPQPAA